MLNKVPLAPLIISSLLSSLLLGCANTDQTPPTFNPEHQARIRVFHGPSAYLYLGNVCDGNIHPVIHAAAGGYSYLARNRTIGMPVADDTPRSYHEYAIPAGQPLTVKMHWQAQNPNGAWTHCGPIHVIFIPEAGHDYEVFMKFRGGMCQGLEIRKLVVDTDGNIETAFAPLNSLPFSRCH